MAEESVEKSQEGAAEETAEEVKEESADTAAETAVASETAGEGEEGAEAAPEAAAPAAGEAPPAEEPAAPVEVKTEAVTPDLKFVKQLMSSGGGDLKKCYQCATCSVVCNLTPDDHPFPRKEMQWAQWGLKDKLMGSPDVWLCHQCSDCVAQCPRDAKPGKVLQAAAKMMIGNYSVGGITRAIGTFAGTIALALIPIAVVLIAIAAQGNFSGIVRPEGDIVYSEFMDIYRVIDPVFTIAFFFAAVVLIVGGRRYWGDMMKSHVASGGAPVKKGFFANIGPTLSELLAHKRFRECDETKDRANSHLLVFYAFLGLALTTAWAVVYIDFAGIESPFSLANPIKWLANISAAAGIIGITLVLIYRFVHSERIGLGSYFDWWLIITIYVILLTGIGAELLRLADTGAAYTVYAIHLMSVLFLFIYAPFSKMAHMVYRFVALVFARSTGRDVGVGI